LTCAEVNRKFPDCNCKKGYYGVGTNLVCLKCHKFCKTCKDTPENCLSCKQGNHREAKPNCACKSGYFNNEVDICVKCVYPCATCDDAKVCKTCVPDGDINKHDISKNC